MTVIDAATGQISDKHSEVIASGRSPAAAAPRATFASRKHFGREQRCPNLA
jgi:hypothetical protein